MDGGLCAPKLAQLSDCFLCFWREKHLANHSVNALAVWIAVRLAIRFQCYFGEFVKEARRPFQLGKRQPRQIRARDLFQSADLRCRSAFLRALPLHPVNDHSQRAIRLKRKSLLNRLSRFQSRPSHALRELPPRSSSPATLAKSNSFPARKAICFFSCTFVAPVLCRRECLCAWARRSIVSVFCNPPPKRIALSA